MISLFLKIKNFLKIIHLKKKKDLNEFIFIFSRYFNINNYCYYFIIITLLFYCSEKLF